MNTGVESLQREDVVHSGVGDDVYGVYARVEHVFVVGEDLRTVAGSTLDRRGHAVRRLLVAIADRRQGERIEVFT